MLLPMSGVALLQVASGTLLPPAADGPAPLPAAPGCAEPPPEATTASLLPGAELQPSNTEIDRAPNEQRSESERRLDMRLSSRGR